VSRALPWQRYPPRIDVDCNCAPRPHELPLSGEIWRYEPAATRWTRVFQSPADVPVPDVPGACIARDVGFRATAVDGERDGRGALGGGGVSAQTGAPRLPGPRLFRSEDGESFAAVDPPAGGALDSFSGIGLRALTVYGGRLYAVAGSLFGDGILLE